MAAFFRATMGIVFVLAFCAEDGALYADPIFTSDYESNPGLPAAYLATWTSAEAHSGSHSIFLPADVGARYYVGGLPDAGNDIEKFTYWTKGGAAATQGDAEIPYSADWTQHVDFIRPSPADNYCFCLVSDGATYLDDMTVEMSNAREFTAIRHADVAALGGTLRLNQASMTQSRLPNTMNALQNGQTLRVVMLGDSIVADQWRSAWDLYVEDHFPGAQVTLIPSVRGGTGMDWYAQTESDGVPRIQTSVLDYQPDLVILGGISTHSSEYFRSVVDQIKAGCNAEILITTGAAGQAIGHAGDARQLPDWTFELDPTDTTGSDCNTVAYREELAQLAAEEGVGFLDTRASWGDFLMQLPTSVPYDDFLRDTLHMNYLGTAVAGQTFEAYFDAALPTPEPASLAVLGMGIGALLLRRRR